MKNSQKNMNRDVRRIPPSNRKMNGPTGVDDILSELENSKSNKPSPVQMKNIKRTSEGIRLNL